MQLVTTRKACCWSSTMSYKLVVVARGAEWVVGDAKRWLLIDCWVKKIVDETAIWEETNSGEEIITKATCVGEKED